MSALFVLLRTSPFKVSIHSSRAAAVFPSFAIAGKGVLQSQVERSLSWLVRYAQDDLCLVSAGASITEFVDEGFSVFVRRCMP